MKFTYLAGRLSGKLFATAAVCAGLMAASLPASADTFSAQFFEVSTSSASTSDFHTGNVSTGTNSSNYVQSGLSGGMPVYNTAQGGTATAPNDKTGAGVIEWWTPGVYGVNTVTATGSSASFSVGSTTGTATSMFPPNSQGTTNQNGFEETAILNGVFTLGAAQTVTFGLAADDDAFIFVDGTYVGGLGGIHGLGSLVNFTTGTLGAGQHTVEIFYADQDEVDASLAISSNVPVSSPTPEPGSLALLGTGVLGLAGTLRRRMKR